MSANRNPKSKKILLIDRQEFKNYISSSVFELFHVSFLLLNSATSNQEIVQYSF